MIDQFLRNIRHKEIVITYDPFLDIARDHGKKDQAFSKEKSNKSLILHIKVTCEYALKNGE